MSILVRSSLLTLVVACAVGCAAGAGKGPGGDGDGDGDGDGGDGDGDGVGDSMGSTGKQTSLDEVREVCETSQVGRPVLRRLTQAEVEATIRDIFNMGDWLGVKLSPDPTSHIGFTNDSSVLVVGGATAKEMLKTAEDVSDVVVAQLGTVLPCSASAADRSCVTEFVNQYGLRLFRRPVTETEVARYADYQQSIAGRSDFATGMKWMLTAMLQSPYAFYRSEIGEASASGRELSNYEMAGQLSYMMVGSTPDAALLARAAAGDLTDPANRAAEAVRLLDSHPHKLEGMRRFFNEWLNYRTVLGKSRDDDPSFADVITPKMVDETRFFLDTVVFGDKGSVDDLMKANFTALDSTLSTFYGYGAVAGAFEKVTRPPEHGMGILAQGSLLASTSHQTATSPTLRGLMMTEKFLCMEAPQVPAVVPTIESTNVGKTANTTREKYELNHAEPGSTCATCHANFEPFGYVFEGFDEMGRMRADEGGFPLNLVVDDAMMPDGSLSTFSNLDELSMLVDSSDDIENCVTGLLAAYMFSGAGGTSCLAEPERALVATGEMSIYDYLIAFTNVPHFSRRE